MRKKIFTILLALVASVGMSWAAGIPCTAADRGKVLCTDGSIYATVSEATAASKTAAAVIAYVDTENGKALALALADESVTMDWETAKTSAAAHTPAVSGGTWTLPSKDDWNNMTNAAGGYAALLNGFSAVGGTNIQESWYWTSTEYWEEDAFACRFDNGVYIVPYPKDGALYVRACLKFDITAAPAPDFAGEGTEASPFLIATAEDWNKLATRVSEGNTYSGVYFQLTNNIAISTMVGLSDHNFNGIFDGAGNTITATLSSDAACCAPFAYTYGATIKNLHTSGTITTTGDNAGGVVGRNGTESLTLTNVSSDMTINSTKANGGLVGYTINATISGCAFTGKLLSETSRRIGGFVGWKSNTTGSYLTITDCVFDPEEVTNANSSSKTFVAIGGGTVTITNSYYTQAYGTDQGKLMHAITAGEGVLVLNTGSATIYNVSGITSYGTGISYNNVLYGGNGDEISLNLSGSDYGYIASTGTLSGTENPYTLTMADADCQINKLAPTPTDVENVQTNQVQGTKILRNGMLLIEKNGVVYNVLGAQVR